ncbi:DNA polymerase I [Candidatus Vallotia tarda]|uniref:DNA polymerase I n=1 Tax=Candidatus Vallotiella hemipterorum TaxID=1177213 RepID=A0A916JT27_9BURK|nr:DNA polymerase I [Candidatus Vallotia tarda]CAG7599096.1 DNA polymerase I [Candidatus Vallotia tarda]
MLKKRNFHDKTLLLVDGSSYLYRAYHALPDLRGPDGGPTGALYGFINMMRRVRREIPTEYGVCVFDAKGKTFREDWYPAYKANRSLMPGDLSRQISLIHVAVCALGWPKLVINRVEADDVLGTLAVRAAQSGMNVVISTGDKDLAQLVNGRITLINTMTNEWLDCESVIKKFGVPPERIIDYLTLIGDTIDNVPGVDKCGPKTALKWLQQYQSLDGIIAHANDIKGALGNNLRRALDFLPTARRLITVHTNCDLSPHVRSITESLQLREEAKDKLRNIYLCHGFKKWFLELDNQSNGGILTTIDSGAKLGPSAVKTRVEINIDRQYEMINKWEQFEKWLVVIKRSTLTSFNAETTSLDPLHARIIGISFATAPGCAAYIPLLHSGQDHPVQLPYHEVLVKLKPWLESSIHKKVSQHLKYNAQVLANYGIMLAGMEHDILLESYVLESHYPHDIDTLAMRHLGIKTIKYKDIAGKGSAQISFDKVTVDVATEYCSEDADITLRLHQVLYSRIQVEKGLSYIYRSIELPTSRVLQIIERNGVLIDKDKLIGHSKELSIRILQLQNEAYALACSEFNLNSPKQISEILFRKLRFPVIKKTSSGAPSTDEEVLQKLAEDYLLPKVLLNYRALTKLKSAYTDRLPKMIKPDTGRVHTNYAQAVVVTGRLASNDPNLQNIPVRTPEGRRIREAFIAPPGSSIVSVDYSQIELRIMAHISGDESLIAAFEQGQDVHKATASEIFGVIRHEITNEQRRIAKVINFGLIYGMSAFGLAANLGIARAVAKLYIERYFARYSGVERYMYEIRMEAKARGFVQTAFGRRLWLPEISGGSSPRRQAAERAAINAPMQGTAADLIKLSMIAVQNWIEQSGVKSRLIMQVHDELVLEVPNNELEVICNKVPKLMCSIRKLNVPLVAKLGAGINWERAH